MARTSAVPRLLVMLAALAAGSILLLPPPACAQEEVASAIRRYKDREASKATTKSTRHAPGASGLSWRSLACGPGCFHTALRRPMCGCVHDLPIHMGIAFYKVKTCETCHPEQAKDIHTVRANLTCRQCHGGEPIASIQHFQSPMNPIRRHAYVCAKCHPGTNASYAAYVVHEPRPSQAVTFKKFPILAYAFWIMVAIAVGTFVVFLPHTFLWGLTGAFHEKGEKEK